MKKLYIVEARRHKGKELLPNKTKDVIGIFSSPEKALKWITTEGKTFFGDKFPRKAFWAVIESIPNSGESYLHAFYNKDGEKIC